MDHKLRSRTSLTNAVIEVSAIEGVVQRLWPKHHRERSPRRPCPHSLGIGHRFRSLKADCRAPIDCVITSTIHVLILVPVFFVVMRERALKRGILMSQRRRDLAALQP